MIVVMEGNHLASTVFVVKKELSHFPSEIASFQVRLHSAILFTARWTANSARRRVVREASVFVLMVASVCVLTSDHKAIARMWALAISMSGYSSGTSQNDSGTKNFLILLIISQYTCFELLFAVLSIVFAHCIIIISDFRLRLCVCPISFCQFYSVEKSNFPLFCACFIRMVSFSHETFFYVAVL